MDVEMDRLRLDPQTVYSGLFVRFPERGTGERGIPRFAVPADL